MKLLNLICVMLLLINSITLSAFQPPLGFCFNALAKFLRGSSSQTVQQPKEEIENERERKKRKSSTILQSASRMTFTPPSKPAVDEEERSRSDDDDDDRDRDRETAKGRDSDEEREGENGPKWEDEWIPQSGHKFPAIRINGGAGKRNDFLSSVNISPEYILLNVLIPNSIHPEGSNSTNSKPLFTNNEEFMICRTFLYYLDSHFKKHYLARQNGIPSLEDCFRIGVNQTFKDISTDPFYLKPSSNSEKSILGSHLLSKKYKPIECLGAILEGRKLFIVSDFINNQHNGHALLLRNYNMSNNKVEDFSGAKRELTEDIMLPFMTKDILNIIIQYTIDSHTITLSPKNDSSTDQEREIILDDKVPGYQLLILAGKKFFDNISEDEAHSIVQKVITKRIHEKSVDEDYQRTSIIQDELQDFTKKRLYPEKDPDLVPNFPMITIDLNSYLHKYCKSPAS